MSEYQYHEWQTVDRVLTPAEQAAVNNLSSHIDVGAGQAIVTYHWSNFRHDPKQVLLKYFDGYFYLANWGSLRLMFRFPNGLLNETDIEPYCMDESISFETAGGYQVLDLDFNSEEGDGWMEAEAGLSLFIQLRADLIEGDFRLLYLAWLKAATLDSAFNAAGEREPPVPPGLKNLSPSLRHFVQVFEIDPFLVQAAAEASPAPKKSQPPDYRKLVGQLSPEERAEYLARLAEGEAGVGLALRKRLRALAPQKGAPIAKSRTLRQLLRRARHLEKAEQARRAEVARRKHAAEMKALAAREAQAWQQVDDLLAKGRKSASVYDEATGKLEKLRQLAEYEERPGDFRARVRRLADQYASRPALIERWKRHRWF